ncbi:BCCT family transporter, partial [Arthrobacter sp. 179]|uniref:BCCT family transporter n=1 Tax=Arthrobacter sp. 179 TaxID=3457734 RepID=UPI0040346D5B
GTGIMFEQQNPGSVGAAYESDGLPAVVMSIAGQLPLSGLVGGAFLLLTVTFVATTTDSMSYAIAQSCTVSGAPSTKLRATWAVLMGVAAAVLIAIGDGGISGLQSFIVITAVPVGFLMLPSVFAAPVFARRMAIEQGIIHPKGSTSAGEGAPAESSVTQDNEAGVPADRSRQRHDPTGFEKGRLLTGSCPFFGASVGPGPGREGASGFRL